MAEASSELEGPDFEKDCATNKLTDGEMLLGHAFGEPVLVVRRGEENRIRVGRLDGTSGSRCPQRDVISFGETALLLTTRSENALHLQYLICRC